MRQITCKSCAFVFPLTEEATLVCPKCGAQYEVTMTTKSAPSSTEPDTQDKGAEGDKGDQEPAPNAGSQEPQKMAASVVVRCTNCLNEWVDLTTRTCPYCDNPNTVAVEKTVQTRVEEAIASLRAGVDPDRVLGMLLGEGDKGRTWKGDLTDLITKLEAIVGELSLPGDTGQLMKALTDGGALKLSGDSASLDVKAAQKPIKGMFKSDKEEESVEAEDVTVVDEPDSAPPPPLEGEPGAEPMPMGPPSEEDIERVLAKYF